MRKNGDASTNVEGETTEFQKKEDAESVRCERGANGGPTFSSWAMIPEIRQMEKTETTPSKSAFKDPTEYCTLKARLRGLNRGGIVVGVGEEEQYPLLIQAKPSPESLERVECDESTRPSSNQEHAHLRSCRVVLNRLHIPGSSVRLVTRAYSAPLRGGGQAESGHGDPSPYGSSQPFAPVRPYNPVIFIMSCATPRQWTSTRATPDISRSRHPPFSSEFLEAKELAVNRLGGSGWSFPPFTAASISTKCSARTSLLKPSAVQDCNQSNFAETLAPDMSSSLDAKLSVLHGN
ncbi:hypothetical protein EV421DRAFT_1971826 [Armillaria borealis]|uniref:Uncharacterized protein n=1 Tax=Armillaria borealis TaxID=47425 RepID=A0AA39J8P3_9AGAR|nr:hypothetical protein EV421DRAFT_1971826 [Armillaria borealis]